SRFSITKTVTHRAAGVNAFLVLLKFGGSGCRNANSPPPDRRARSCRACAPNRESSGRTRRRMPSQDLPAACPEAIEEPDAADEDRDQRRGIIAHAQECAIPAFEQAKQQDSGHQNAEQACDDLEAADHVENGLAYVDDLGEKDQEQVEDIRPE